MHDADQDMQAYLALEDGTVIEGKGHGGAGTAQGELVFNTEHTGYEESLTDPSYTAQLLLFTYPLIGNYGVDERRFQSDEIQAEACIANRFSEEYGGIVDWFLDEEIPAMSHVDTRDLTLKTREHGTMKAGMVVGEDATAVEALDLVEDCPDISDLDLGDTVSPDEPELYGGYGQEEGLTMALIDCGVKRSIIDSLRDRNMDVASFPYDATPDEVGLYDPDALFVSNGPGDPANYGQAVDTVDHFVGQIPVAGVCMGQQVVGQAFGAETYKLPFGHRGANQPVRNRDSGRVSITAQNHGYSVDPDSLDGLDVTEVNVNDGTVEGLENEDLKIITRQYHPEAHPGPHDMEEEFFDTVRSYAEEGL